MSMISAQIDELRNAAEFYDGFKAANLMRDAADTIGELRGALQVASVDYRQLAAESARLRERYEEYEQKMDGLVDVLTGGLLSKSASTPNEFIEDAASEHLTKDLAEENARLVVKLNAEHLVRQNAESENAKLRELLQRTWDAFHDATAREFVTVKNELRELGIEVDG